MAQDDKEGGGNEEDETGQRDAGASPQPADFVETTGKGVADANESEQPEDHLSTSSVRRR